MSLRNIFLDDGGVMNDNSVRGPQWQWLVGEFMALRLGREPRDWAEANRNSFEETFRQYEPKFRNELLTDIWNDYLFDWLQMMCEQVGVSVPEREDAVSIASEAHSYITRRVHAAFPGVVDTIRELHTEGYHLHTASGGRSHELAGYLEAMGVRDLFGRLYGPDLVGLPLQGPQYYRRLFEDSGSEAEKSVVVDDSLERAAWVMEAGAVAVLVSPSGLAPNVQGPIISSLAELPSLLQTLAAACV